jgi:hypothetical protein
MSGETRITPEAAQTLATAAQLRLAPDRAPAVADQLSVWLTAANELNLKMSAPEHRQRAPITSFTHPESEVLE